MNEERQPLLPQRAASQSYSAAAATFAPAEPPDFNMSPCTQISVFGLGTTGFLMILLNMAIQNEPLVFIGIAMLLAGGAVGAAPHVAQCCVTTVKDILNRQNPAPQSAPAPRTDVEA